MKQFPDTSVLVESCLHQSPKFAAADALINRPGACTSAHALAETYATLSGNPRLKISPADAAQMVADLAKVLGIHTFTESEYHQLIMSAPRKGIRGGSIYDALHAQTARAAECKTLHTLNITHFKHVVPDLMVVDL